MPLDIAQAAELAELRRRALANELSDDQLREWITKCREGRVGASVRSATSRAKKAPPDMGALLDELENL